MARQIFLAIIFRLPRVFAWFGPLHRNAPDDQEARPLADLEGLSAHMIAQSSLTRKLGREDGLARVRRQFMEFLSGQPAVLSRRQLKLHQPLHRQQVGAASLLARPPSWAANEPAQVGFAEVAAVSTAHPNGRYPTILLNFHS